MLLKINDWNSNIRISGKKEKSMISEQEKVCANKIDELEESLKKKKQVTFLKQLITAFPSLRNT